MGKSCLRFTRADDIPLDLIGETNRPRQPGQFPGALQNGPRLVGARHARPTRARGMAAERTPSTPPTGFELACWRRYLPRRSSASFSADRLNVAIRPGAARGETHCSSIELRTPLGRVTRIHDARPCSACPLSPVISNAADRKRSRAPKARTTLSVSDCTGWTGTRGGSAADQGARSDPSIRGGYRICHLCRYSSQNAGGDAPRRAPPFSGC